MMSKFLLDSNLSPETAKFLIEQFGFDSVALISLNKGQLPDEEVVKLAQSEGRVIITFDQDFGEIYYFKEKGNFGVIVLKLEDQTIESVNQILKKFFQSEDRNIRLENSLVILEKTKIRVII